MVDVGPLRIEIVRGEPVRVHDRVLTPVVRMTSALTHRGTIRKAQVEGIGGGVVVVQPVGVIEERDGVERVLPIGDVTATVLQRMALLAGLISAIAALLIVANRLARQR